jgi:hypothetical protein
LGFSQGGYLLRGYLEKYNQPRMKRFITLTSPLTGYFCGRYYECVEGFVIPEFLNNLAPIIIYSEFG